MHFKIIKYSYPQLPCSLCQQKGKYEIFLYYEEGRHNPIGRFCEKHFKELQKEMKQVSRI